METDKTRRQPATVLVVDDAEANIDILVELLGGDYDVSAALSGAEALDSVAQAPPDIILLDIMMPGMDGYEVCRRLKADERTADIPVLFITALSGPDDETRGLDLGAIDFITKPFSPAVVRARVRNHLALREAARLREDVERIMHHDLKSPLTTVVSLPQLLLMDDNLTEPQRDMLQRIEDAGYTLLAMVNLTTALFRMERGRFALTPERLDLAALARKVLAGFRESAGMRGIRLRLTLGGVEARDDDESPCTGEELLLHSMLANLVANALDASPRGEDVTVDITAQDGGTVRIEIVNSGEVPAEMRERFFEKYATAGKTRGTGLGTYSARLIARAHGGEISMRSGNGRVVVGITLPA